MRAAQRNGLALGALVFPNAEVRRGSQPTSTYRSVDAEALEPSALTKSVVDAVDFARAGGRVAAETLEMKVGHPSRSRRTTDDFPTAEQAGQHNHAAYGPAAAVRPSAGVHRPPWRSRTFPTAPAPTIAEAAQTMRGGDLQLVMISCALTLPTFGSASNKAEAFILPRTSSVSRVGEHLLEVGPTSRSRAIAEPARARRCGSSFSKAAARCSSVTGEEPRFLRVSHQYWFRLG